MTKLGLFAYYKKRIQILYSKLSVFSTDMLLTKGPFLRDFDLNCADMKAASADIAFHSIWLLSSGVNLISWIDEIPILFLDFNISRSKGNKPWCLLMSSSVCMLRCLCPTESNGMRSDTQEIIIQQYHHQYRS